MKQITSKHAIWAGLLLCSALAAPANTMVTFWVDMSQQAASFNPASQTVSVHGSFNGWTSAGVPMTKSTTNDYVWTATYNVPTNGIAIEYKYVIDPSGWENIPKGGNRLVLLPSASGSSLELTKVYYADVPPVFVSADLVFKVDLAQQVNVGAFIPGTSIAYVRGNFNGWGLANALTNDPSILRTNQNGLVTANVYVGTYPGFLGSPGQTVDYKFYIDTGDKWEAPNHLTTDPDGNNYNRFLNLPTADGTLVTPIAFFNDQPYAPVATNAVTFQVDMSAQVLAGNFDPLTGTVEVRGNFNSWGGTKIYCTNNPAATNTNLYTAVVTVVDGLGATEQYKFWASVSENGGWETMAGNRTFTTVSSASLVLPPVFFNNVDPRDLLPVNTLVTFSVDMSKAATYPDNVPFNPAVSTNYFNGNCLTNGWYGTWGGFWPETQMFDDGTHGDAVVGDRIHTFQYLVPKGKTLRVAYKYGINSADNEAPSGQDHVRYIRSTGTYVMPLDTFGSQFQEPQYGGPIIAKSAGGKVMISWLGYPGVQLATTDKLGGTWTNHPASDGLSSTNYPVGSGTLFFKLVKP